MSWRRWTGALLLALAGLALYWYLPAPRLDARFGPEDCHRLALTGPDGPITGAEDLAWDAGRGVLYVSAYDRRAVDRALAEGAPPAAGGLYALPRAALDGTSAEARPLVTGHDLKGGVRPHGIDLAGDRLYLINRTFPQGGQETAIWRLDLATAALTPVAEAPELCAANDLAWTGPADRLAVTLDRRHCPGIDWTEMAFGGATGQVATVDAGSVTATGAYRFPNGIAVSDGRTVIAETRGRAIRVLPDGPALALAGGPDNLGTDGDALIAALHPDSLKIAGYLRGWLDRAPSRIVRVDPRDPEAAEILFDDPAGELLSGASVGLMVDGMLVAGSAVDAGLLVCR